MFGIWKFEKQKKKNLELKIYREINKKKTKKNCSVRSNLFFNRNQAQRKQRKLNKEQKQI